MQECWCNPFGRLTDGASAAAGFRSEAKLELKRRKTKTGNNQTLDQAVGCMRSLACRPCPIQELTHLLANGIITQLSVKTDCAPVELMNIQLDSDGAFDYGPLINSLHEHTPYATATKV